MEADKAKRLENGATIDFPPSLFENIVSDVENSTCKHRTSGALTRENDGIPAGTSINRDTRPTSDHLAKTVLATIFKDKSAIGAVGTISEEVKKASTVLKAEKSLSADKNGKSIGSAITKDTEKSPKHFNIVCDVKDRPSRVVVTGAINDTSDRVKVPVDV